MKSQISKKNGSLILSNGIIEAEFSTDKRISLSYFRKLTNGKSFCQQNEYIIVFDRNIENLSQPGSAKFAKIIIREADETFQGPGMEAVLFFTAIKSGLEIEKHIFIYDESPAIRIYDIFKSKEPLSGLYYSDLIKVDFNENISGKCVEYFTCTDQSNWRLIEKDAGYKNKGGFFITNNGIFLYKECPMPDSQPIKGEYDFIFKKDERSVSVVGVGFDKIYPGEIRRTNGIVLGVTEDEFMSGLRKYQNSRYKIKHSTQIEYITNSWPAFHFDISEDKILKEIEIAAKLGIKTVFIDDGWFETFMGEIDKNKFPNSFTKIAESAKFADIEVGLWMNPMGLDIIDKHAREWDGAEAHDTISEGNNWNWAARNNDFHYSKISGCGKAGIYCTVDIMNEEYFEHIKNKVISLYEKFRIRRFKFDLYQLNVLDTLLGDPHQHYEKYRDLLNSLKEAIPGLIISMDVTRRNRPCFDFGMDYGRLFLENRGRRHKDHRYYHPYISLRNLWYTAKYFPAQKIEIEMMPQIDDYPMDYVLSTTIFANPLYWGSLTEMTEKKISEAKKFIDILRPHKSEIMKGQILPIGELPDKGNWSGFVSVIDSINGYIAVYRNGSKDSRYRLVSNPFEAGKYNIEDIFSGEIIKQNHEIKWEFEIDNNYGFRLFKVTKTHSN